MKKLSLAIFNTQPPHLYFGGVERRIVEITKRLKTEVNTTIYSGTKAGFRKPTSIGGINLVPGFSTDALFPLDNWFFNRTIAEAVNTIKANVYEADEYMQSFQGGSSTFRSKLANLIMWRLSKLEEKSAKNATLTVTVSNYSSEKIVQFFIEQKIYTFCHNQKLGYKFT